MAKKLLVVAVLGLIGVSLVAQSKPSIHGVWRAQEIAYVGGSKPITIKNPQTYIRIYTGKHFSLVGTNTGSEQPRKPLTPPKDPAKLTDAEKIARYEHWLQFQAQAGTYEIKGGRIVHRWLVGKNEALQTQEHEFKLDGNTLVLTNTAAADDGARLQVRYTRLE